MKQLKRYGVGVKQGVHGVSKFGVKLSHSAAGLAPPPSRSRPRSPKRSSGCRGRRSRRCGCLCP